MSGWLATDSKDCFTVHVADDQETAETASGSFAVKILFGPILIAVAILKGLGKIVINHSKGDN
jgi:hypothetical protein